MKILIVEDDARLISIVREALTRRGHVIDTARSSSGCFCPSPRKKTFDAPPIRSVNSELQTNGAPLLDHEMRL
jgi:CheY-like chemotaxis protein